MEVNQLPLTKWRDFLPTVVQNINAHNEQKYKSVTAMLNAYFTQPKMSHMPQSYERMYKFKVNDRVGLHATPAQRKSFSFKYSLNRGEQQGGGDNYLVHSFTYLFSRSGSEQCYRSNNRKNPRCKKIGRAHV